MKRSSAHFARRTQKGIIHVVPLLIILAVAGLLVWFFLNKGGLGTKGMAVPITPSQLMPSVSAARARTNICNIKKEGLFARACQEKFNVVGKDDKEKLADLFTLVKKIQDDKSLSDYDRLLLGQVVFASLPTKESPQAKLDYSLLTHLRDFLKSKSIAYAKEQIMGEEEFRQMMTNDLKGVVDLPKGNNAWTINVMVSKYQWINGQRQPIYADQYVESFDPYPGNSVESKDKSKISYNVRAVIGSRATSQEILESPFKGTGEMTMYSFSIMSWYSQPYGEGSVLIKAEAGPDAKYLTSRQDRSEENYSGENLLSDLLKEVKMPSREQQKKSESKTTFLGGNSNELDCYDMAVDATRDPKTQVSLWGYTGGRGEFSYSSDPKIISKNQGENFCVLSKIQMFDETRVFTKSVLKITYFPQATSVTEKFSSLKGSEESGFEIKDSNENSYTGRTARGDPIREDVVNYAKKVDISGNCLVELTYTLNRTSAVHDNPEIAKILMDAQLEGVKSIQAALLGSEKLQRFCEKK